MGRGSNDGSNEFTMGRGFWAHSHIFLGKFLPFSEVANFCQKIPKVDLV